MRRLIAAIALLSLAVWTSAAATANWLTKLGRTAEHAPSGRALKGAAALDHAAAHIASIPGKAPALAASLGPEGHWTLINRAGERFTAASADELKRGLTTLAPDAAKSDVKLTLYITEDSLFRDRARLRDLPASAELRIFSGKLSHALIQVGEGANLKLFTELRPNLLIEAGDAARYAEAAYQLNRPLGQSRIRVLALDPQGPKTLTSGPRLDPATGRTLIDPISPDALVSSLGNLRGQTALLVARREGDTLVFNPVSGAERRISWREITAEAERWDVNLLIVRAAQPNQPGARNWLWQRVGVKGLDDALVNTTMADVLSGLLPKNTRHVATATPRGLHQTTLEITPTRDLPATTSTAAQLGDKMVDAVSELAGHIVNSGVDAIVTSEERKRELDDRIIPGIPSAIQWGYIVMLMLGMFGSPVAARWWHRIWPEEARESYEGATGYWAARSVRGFSFWIIFAPLTAIATAPLQALTKLWDLIAAPMRFWRWLRPQKPA